MARIFILEDDFNRMQQFYRKLHQHTIMHSDNVADAKTILSENEFDILFFDHDLGGDTYVDSAKENTGYQLAKWIRETGKMYPQAFIHSMNPTGADNIAHELKRNIKKIQKIPFSILINEL